MEATLTDDEAADNKMEIKDNISIKSYKQLWFETFETLKPVVTNQEEKSKSELSRLRKMLDRKLRHLMSRC